MSDSGFAFIPRKLAKRPTRVAEDAKKNLASQVDVQSGYEASTSTSHDKRKEEKFLDDSAYTALLELSLSEHALWSNTGPLEAMEANDDGFIPISYLAQSSSVFAGLAVVPPETVLMRCVRSSNTLEGRLIVAQASSSGWAGGRGRHETWGEGGYEVRRKDWKEVKDRIRKYTPFHWQSRTVYVENLPYNTKAYYAVYDFVRQLLPDKIEESDSSLIQSISFPRHHKDAADAPPPAVNKGFAFIILSHTKHADYLLERWPWDFDDRPKNAKEGEVNKAVQEAEEYGFRCLSKQKWDEMKEQYLTLQHQFLEKTMMANEAGPSTSKPIPSDGALVLPHERGSFNENQGSTIHAVEEPAWFPKDCLVFVKNVHPETNKTTLRTLFSSAFDTDASLIDYVDYNKGLDSCYLRLSDPDHARTLVSYFSEHKTTQANALDNGGVPASRCSSIEVELVQGKKEEVYWEKVPEKIRQAALTKAQTRGEYQTPPHEKDEEGGARKRRKRRKRDSQ